MRTGMASIIRVDNGFLVALIEETEKEDAGPLLSLFGERNHSHKVMIFPTLEEVLMFIRTLDWQPSALGQEALAKRS